VPELISILWGKEMNAGELGGRLGLALTNLAQHLIMMRERYILISRKKRNIVYYRITSIKLLRVFDMSRVILFEQIR
jgi:ArsR family transcriptional regulator